MDEIVSSEDGTPANVTDTSITQDRGLFSWIVATFKIKLVPYLYSVWSVTMEFEWKALVRRWMRLSWIVKKKNFEQVKEGYRSGGGFLRFVSKDGNSSSYSEWKENKEIILLVDIIVDPVWAVSQYLEYKSVFRRLRFELKT